MARSVLIATVATVAASPACKPKHALTLRGLVTLDGNEADSYPPRVGTGTKGGFLSIDEVPSPTKGGATLTAPFTLSPRSGLRQLNATVFLGDDYQDLLLDAAATAVTVDLPARSITSAKIRLRAVTVNNEIAIVDSNAFYVDGQAPSVVIGSYGPVAAGGSMLTLAVAVTDDDQVASAQCSLAGNGVSTAWQDATGGSVTVTLPSTDIAGITLACQASDRVGNMASAKSAAFNVDATAPALTLDPLPAAVRGGSSVAVSWTAADIDPVLSFQVELSTDGGLSFSVAAAGLGASPYLLALPLTDTTNARVRLSAADRTGHASQANSADFVIDSTAPTAPTFAWVTPSDASPYTNARAVTLAAATCTTSEPIAMVLVEYQGMAPSAADPAWQACSLTALPSLLPDQDGPDSASIWLMDALGNVSSTPVQKAIVLDRVPPSLSLLTPAPGPTLIGGAPLSVTYTLSDANLGATPASVSLSQNGGGSFAAITGCQALAANAPCTTSVPLIDSTLVRFAVAAVDLAGNTSSAASPANLFVDSSPPVFDTFTFTSTGATTVAPVTPVSITIHDAVSAVTELCVKVLAPASYPSPAANDACWIGVDEPLVGVTPAPSISVPDYDVFLDLLPGATFTAYAWAKDAVGKITVLSAAELGTDGIDRSTVSLVSDPPPVVSDVIVNSDDSNLPATTIATGAGLYIKWRAVDSNLLAAPIAVYTTSDEIAYTQIGPSGVTGSGANLQNAVNAGDGPCTTTPPETGCVFIGAAAPSGYFRVRVTATDRDNQTAAESSPSANSSKVRVIAGNTDAGTNTTATRAFFFSRITDPVPDARTFAITRKGVLYFIDQQRGLVTVDPKSRTLRILIAPGAAVSGAGDGGPIGSAQLRNAYRLALDDQDNLLVADSDRVRKLDFGAGSIDTVIGGGSDTSDSASARNVKITAGASQSATVPFFTTPNGDLYFTSEITGGGTIGATSYRVRHYARTTGMVDAIHPSGIGHTDGATDDITQCGPGSFALQIDPTSNAITYAVLFMGADDIVYPNCTLSGPGSRSSLAALDPSTWQAVLPAPPHGFGGFYDYYAAPTTGADGRLYWVAKGSDSSIRVLNTSTSPPSWDRVVGTGENGSCDDGTPALSCAIDPEDVFVTREGRVFFLERSRIRVVDSLGIVRTLYGEGYAGGDGGNPLSARFKSVDFFDRRLVAGDSEITLYDSQAVRLRAFLTLGSVDTVAGNGIVSPGNSVDLTLAPDAQPIPALNGFAYNALGNVLFASIAHTGASPSRKYVLQYQPGAPASWVIVAGSSLITNPDFDVDPEASAQPPLALTGASGDTGVVNMSNARYVELIGYDATANEAIVHFSRTNGVILWDMVLKRLAFGSNQYLRLAGLNDDVLGATPPSTWCSDLSGATLAINCRTPPLSYKRAQIDYGAADAGPQGRWLVASANDPLTVVGLYLPSATGAAKLVANTAQPITSFAFHREAFEEIIYCGNGVLRRKTLPAGPEVVVTLPPAMTCAGDAMIYIAPDAEKTYHRVLFPFLQYGLGGVAELDLSP